MTNVVDMGISTHTLTWSVTDETVDRVLEFYDFNSHAHVERDTYFTDIDFKDFISTHTLTWSVTAPVVEFFKAILISTHTLTWSVT